MTEESQEVEQVEVVPEEAPPPPAPPTDEELVDLRARATERDEYLALAQRAQADLENFRKKARREAGEARTRGLKDLASELLPALDNLGLALAAADRTGAGLAEGVKLVEAELAAALARQGIEPYSPEGEPFDPEHHEAIATAPAGEVGEPGVVVEVYQRGWRCNGTVLRPARVVVAG